MSNLLTSNNKWGDLQTLVVSFFDTQEEEKGVLRKFE